MKDINNIENAKIAKNLKAFKANFENDIIIKKASGCYLVYRDFFGLSLEQWIYVTDDINNLNGWLYGAVMANCGVITKRKEIQS